MIPSLKGCSSLSEFTIHDCRDLTNISGLKNCINLTKIEIEECNNNINLEPLATCSQLKIVIIKGNYSPNSSIKVDITIFENMPLLKVLGLQNCSFNKDLSFENYFSLKELHLKNISGNFKIKQLPSVNHKSSGLKCLILNQIDIIELKDNLKEEIYNG